MKDDEIMADFYYQMAEGFEKWIRDGIFSKTVKGTVIGLTDIIYYPAFIVCCFCGYMGTTMFKDLYSESFAQQFDNIYRAAVLIVLVCGLAAVAAEFRIQKIVICALITFAGFMHLTHGGQYYYLFAMCALIVGSSGRSLRGILLINLIVGGAVVIVAFLASQMGIITDLVYEGGRHSFGINYCTNCAAHILFLMMTYCMLRVRRFALIDYALLMVATTFMMFTNAKTNLACAVLLIAGMLVFQTLRWIDKEHHLIVRLAAAFLSFSFIWCTALCFVTVLGLDLNDRALRRRIIDTFDYSLVRRMELSRDAILEYPFTWFGTKIRQRGYGGKTEGLPSWEKYNFIDCSYVRLYVLGGALLFVLLLFVLTYIMLRCYAYKRYDFVFILAVFAIPCIMEHHLLEFYYNIFPLMAFANSDILQIKKGHRKT